MLTVKATPKYTIIETHCLAFPKRKGADMIEAVPLSSHRQPKTSLCKRAILVAFCKIGRPEVGITDDNT